MMSIPTRSQMVVLADASNIGSFSVLYMRREFNFAHLMNPGVIGDSMHLHSYRMEKQPDKSFRLVMESRMSTDAEGIATCLGLKAEARIELEEIIQALQTKISLSTLFVPV